MEETNGTRDMVEELWWKTYGSSEEIVKREE